MFIESLESSLVGRIIQEETKQIAALYKVGDITSINYSTKSLVNGHILAPISPDKQSILDLLENPNIRFGTDMENVTQGYNGGDFITKMKGTVLIVEKELSIVEAINYSLSFIKKAGNNFYGAVLKCGNDFINPFHPLFSIGFIENTDDTRKYKLYLYFYPNRDDLDIVYNTQLADPELIEKNLQSICRAYSSEAESSAMCTKVEIKDNDVEVHHRREVKFTSYESISGSSANMEYYLSAQQVLTRGIFFPYYGSSLIRKSQGERGEGCSLTPFLAVNIGTPNYNAKSASFTSICTGSQSGHTLEGIRSLTHANLSSPMNRLCLLPGCLAYADAAINLALKFYYKAGIINEEVQIESPSTKSPEEIYGKELIKEFLRYPSTFVEILIDDHNIPITKAVTTYKELAKLNDEGKLDEFKTEDNKTNNKPSNNEESAEAIDNDTDDTVYNHNNQEDPRHESTD